MSSGYCRYGQYFEVLYCGYFRARSIAGFVSVDARPTSNISEFCTAGTASTGRFSSGGTTRTASARSTKILNTLNIPSILGV